MEPVRSVEAARTRALTFRGFGPYKSAMFGLSLTKILFTIMVVLAVWYGYRWIGRVHARRRVELDEQMRREMRQASKRRPDRSGGATKAEDLVPCGTCGSYVPARGPRNCGRADCPYPG